MLLLVTDRSGFTWFNALYLELKPSWRASPVRGLRLLHLDGRHPEVPVTVKGRRWRRFDWRTSCKTTQCKYGKGVRRSHRYQRMYILRLVFQRPHGLIGWSLAKIRRRWLSQTAWSVWSSEPAWIRDWRILTNLMSQHLKTITGVRINIPSVSRLCYTSARCLVFGFGHEATQRRCLWPWMQNARAKAILCVWAERRACRVISSWKGWDQEL